MREENAKEGPLVRLDEELRFLTDALKKCHIQTAVISLGDRPEGLPDSLIGARAKTVGEMVGEVEEVTKYCITSGAGLHYLLLRLPIPGKRDLLLVGPYLTAKPDSSDMLLFAERLGLAPSAYRFLEEYYATLPIIAEHDRILTVIDTFCEHLWRSPSFAIVEIDAGQTRIFSAVDPISRTDDFSETLASVERMERRYAFENELIRAVVRGQQHKESELLSAFSERLFERRVQDPLRNAKNYCIIMNTLLRKAAEEGGVHPLYIDRTSSAFAMQIESASDLKEIPELMREMFSSYCRLVRRHSTGRYSAVVKNTVLMIDADISAELTLQALAEGQGVTAGYLATVFKKETGKTVIEYIRARRISRAKRLLSTTDLQIQTVAMHAGITDVQYFSRLFKRETGMTPREYRRAKKER